MALHLVRHGRPLVDPAVPAAAWSLDPQGYDDVWALRGRLPQRATWYSSPEPKARETAQLLTDGPVGVIDDLREHVRPGWVEDFEVAVADAFAVPASAARPGWETLDACRERVVQACTPIRAAHVDEDVVLVGHGTAWTLLRAHLERTTPDVAAWRAWSMPDLVRVG